MTIEFLLSTIWLVLPQAINFTVFGLVHTPICGVFNYKALWPFQISLIKDAND